jgi:cytochrome c biogenesis protein CcmG/thiol:disulfide interchange protein DsbE
VDEPVIRRILRASAVLLAAGLVGLLAWATLAASQGKNLVTRIAAGESPSAPRFELEAIWPENERWPQDLERVLADGELSLEELRGQPAVLNFWASWCVPCRDEAPILAASARAHAGELRFVGVNVQDLRGDALAFLREFRVPFVSVRDQGGDTYRAYGLTGVPETYYLDAAGRIVAHSPGAVSRVSLEEGIKATTEATRP